MAEYAKLVKIKTENLSDKGFKATLTLPTSKSFQGPADYINFYCGIGSYECGISCKPVANGVLRWRAFANGEGGTTYGPEFYTDGSTVTISTEINDQNLVEFRANGTLIKKFTKSLTSFPNSARLILAAYQHGSTTAPLDKWVVSHKQVRAYNMQYKNSNKQWVAFRDGNKVTTEEWPTGVSTPDGMKYTLDKSYIGNAEVYASLNK